MTADHVRIVNNGTPDLITTRQAIDEIESAMTGATRKDVRQMSASRSGANIEYRDGRKVDIRPATPEEIATTLVVDTVEHVIELSEDGGEKWRQAAGHAYQDKAEADAAASRLAADKRNKRVIFRVAEMRLTVTAAGEIAATRKPDAPEQTADGLRIVTVKGKRYIVSKRISQSQTSVIGGVERTWPGGVNYWSERNGKEFGATRVALSDSKPGTVGAVIWAAVNR